MDIINLSLGFGEASIDCVEAALNRAYTRNVHVFAAAANHGANAPRPFPANYHTVFCISASDGVGAWARSLNPPSPHELDRWNTLGIGIEFSTDVGNVWKSGTSYAAPLAVSIIANAFHMVRTLRAQAKHEANKLSYLQNLEKRDGVRKLLSLMCDDNKKGFIAPWLIWRDGRTPEQVVHAWSIKA